MTFSYPKQEHTILPSREEVHIFRDPPKSIHTRKKERVETGDIMYMMRENFDRISENIELYPRGINHMVGINYTNQGNVTGGLGNQCGGVEGAIPMYQGSTPYKVGKNGAFRPPMFSLEDTLPLSRQKRPWTVVQSGLRAPTQVVQNISEKRIDKQTIKSTIHPTTVYNMRNALDGSYTSNAILDPLVISALSGLGSSRILKDEPMSGHNIQNCVIIRPSISVASSLGVPNQTITVTDIENKTTKRHLKDQPIISYLSPKFSVAFAGENHRGLALGKLSDKESLKIAIQANKGLPIDITKADGTVIRVKDYTWKIFKPSYKSQNIGGISEIDTSGTVKSNVMNIEGNTNKYQNRVDMYDDVNVTNNTKDGLNVSATTNSTDILIIEPLDVPDFHFKSNNVYDVRSNIKLHTNNIEIPDVPILDGRPLIHVNSSINSNLNNIDNINRDARLPDTLKVGNFEGRGVIPSFDRIGEDQFVITEHEGGYPDRKKEGWINTGQSPSSYTLL